YDGAATPSAGRARVVFSLMRGHQWATQEKEAEAMDDRGRSGVKRAASVRARALVGIMAVLAVVVPAAMASDPRDTRNTLERHAPSGQFFNWYDHTTGQVLTMWPPSGAPLTPILSSVDNGWLATALHLVRNQVPELSERAGTLFDQMDFGFYYLPEVNRILFHYAPSTGEAPCCYDTIVSESRIASYIGIAKGDLPSHHYFGAWRSFPQTCDWSWQETKPRGFSQTYSGVTVFEGAYRYASMRLVPSWGGSMF